MPVRRWQSIGTDRYRSGQAAFKSPGKLTVLLTQCRVADFMRAGKWLMGSLPRTLTVSLVVALLAVQGVCASHWIISYQIADDDAGQAVILARQCIELGQCEAKGPRTTLVPLSHGASWTRLIAYTLTHGGDLRAVQMAVIGLLLGSGVVAFELLRRHLSLPAASLSLLFYVQPIMAAADFPTFVNSNLLPLPLALYYATVVLGVTSRDSAVLAAASLWLAGAISANLSCAIVIPFHVAVVLMFARAPVMAAASSLVILALAFGSESPGVARNLIAFANLPLVAAVLVIGVLCVAIRPIRVRMLPLWASHRDRWQRRRTELGMSAARPRVRTVMRAVVGYVSTTMWIACLVTGYGIPPPPRFFASLVIPVLYLAIESAAPLSEISVACLYALGFIGLALLPFSVLAPGVWGIFLVLLSGVIAIRGLVWILLRRFTDRQETFSHPTVYPAFVLAGVTLAAAVPSIVVRPLDRQAMPVAAAERIVRHLYASGLRFPDIFAALQLPSYGKVLPLLAAEDPDLFKEAEYVSGTGWSLLTLTVDRAVAAQTQGILVTAPISGSMSSIAVRAPSYLDRMHLRTCPLAECGGDVIAERCTERALKRPLRHEWPFLENPAPRELTQCVIFSIPVRTSGSGVPHVVRVIGRAAGELRVRRVTGVDFEGELPGLEVRLLDQRESAGTLEIELHPSEPFYLGEPPLIEVAADNEHLLTRFREGRVLLW